MRIKGLICILAALVLLMPVVAQAQAKRIPVKIDGMKVLPLRVLTRPFSKIYQSPDEASTTVRDNLAAFQPFYVYTRPGEEQIINESGWYEVGTDVRGTVLGWMKADDVFEWKQTMCLAYTHPGNRKPVLMFDGKDVLMNMVKEPPEQRSAQAQQYYTAIEQNQITPDFPVKSIEPKKAVDISQQFYLLPILDHEVIEIEGREGRLLRLAAVTGAGPKAREASDIRQNPEYLEESKESSTQAPSELLKKLVVDVVFVVDTTVSMRPYINATLDVVRDVARNLAQNPEVSEGVRLGFWGYRDSVNDIPGIGYTTKNYTPQLQTIDQFQQTLAQVQVTQVDSKDWNEDVFSGVSDAMSSTQWTPNSIRILVLMGDAAGHEPGHPWNLSGLSASTLRAMANDSSHYIFAVHIKPVRAPQHQAPAEEQFRVLSANPGVDEPAYVDVMSDDMEGFANAPRQLTDSVVQLVTAAKHGGSPVAAAPGSGGGMVSTQPDADNPFNAPLDAPSSGSGGGLASSDDPFAAGGGQQGSASEAPASSEAGAAPPAGGETGEMAGAPSTGGEMSEMSEMGEMGGQGAGAAEPDPDPVRAKANQVVRAALVDWIGSQTKALPPRDIVAWVVDKDLMNPDVASLEVRLLVTKNQLDSMRTVLNDVMAAGVRGQLGGEDFFSALQATSAVAARDPNLLKNAQTLAQTGLIPEFLKGLPYHSRLMEMSNDLWASWSVDEQDLFINELKAKIEAYESMHDNPGAWVELNKGDDPDQFVFPVSLELLP